MQLLSKIEHVKHDSEHDWQTDAIYKYPAGQTDKQVLLKNKYGE